MFVTSTLYFETKGCERHSLFTKGVAASKKVGNLLFIAKQNDNKKKQ